MPCYDYRCNKCERVFESIEKMGVEEINCEHNWCNGRAFMQLSRPRHFDKLGSHSNLSSVRFNFNYMGE